MLTTATNLGGPFATAISNGLFGLFKPSLSDGANYVADTPAFRNQVALSCAIGYACTFVSLLLLPLLPSQKEDTQHRKATRPRGDVFAYATVAILTLALAYATTIDMLAIFPETACLKIAGGQGCDPPAAVHPGHGHLEPSSQKLAVVAQVARHAASALLPPNAGDS